MPHTEEQEALLREHHPELLKTIHLNEKLDEILTKDPIAWDLNPHIQVQMVADQVVDFMRNEKKEHIDREDVLLIWLTEIITGTRNDRVNMDGWQTSPPEIGSNIP